MEGRGQRYLELNCETCAGNSAESNKQIWNSSGQLEMYPDRWLRISFASRNPEMVFNNLFCHFNIDSLREAYNALDGSKALGIDGVSKMIYGKNLEANLKGLTLRIRNGSYKPQPKREVLIPKANGKTRPIAISCFEDKLVEWVLAKILENVYESTFIQNSFGFRPYKSADGAIRATYHSLKEGKRSSVVEIDFANFFNSIPHGKLMKILTKKITDNKIKGLIGRFLNAGILEQSGDITSENIGTPQGSIMSPILANIYLHYVLDVWFLNNYASYNNIIVRYADDAVFFFNSEETAKSFVQALKLRVQLYGLTLNMDKTTSIEFGKNDEKSFSFLGFTFYWGKKTKGVRRKLKIKTNQKTLHKKIQEFYLWIKLIRSKLKTGKIWELARAKIRGHYNYYGYAMNLPKINQFYFEAIRSMFKWLNRRSQKKSFTWKKFLRKLKFNPLTAPPPMSKLKHIEWSSMCPIS